VARGRSLVIIAALLMGLFAAAGPAHGEPCLWSAPTDQILGAVALVATVNLEEKEGPAIRIDELELYPCDLPRCKKGKPLTLVLTTPPKNEGRSKHYFLVLDLPAGGYRLAMARGRLISDQKVRTFELPLHYLFQATAGKTTYLGRLNISPAVSLVQYQPGGKKRAPVRAEEELESEVVDLFAYDAPAILQAYPDRHFYRMTTGLMVWEEE